MYISRTFKSVARSFQDKSESIEKTALIVKAVFFYGQAQTVIADQSTFPVSR